MTLEGWGFSNDRFIKTGEHGRNFQCRGGYRRYYFRAAANASDTPAASRDGGYRIVSIVRQPALLRGLSHRAALPGWHERYGIQDDRRQITTTQRWSWLGKKRSSLLFMWCSIGTSSSRRFSIITVQKKSYKLYIFMTRKRSWIHPITKWCNIIPSIIAAQMLKLNQFKYFIWVCSMEDLILFVITAMAIVLLLFTSWKKLFVSFYIQQTNGDLVVVGQLNLHFQW